MQTSKTYTRNMGQIVALLQVLGIEDIPLRPGIAIVSDILDLWEFMGQDYRNEYFSGDLDKFALNYLNWVTAGNMLIHGMEYASAQRLTDLGNTLASCGGRSNDNKRAMVSHTTLKALVLL